LCLNDLGGVPIDFFVKWFKEAENSDQIIEPNALTISTVDENSFPSSRVVLLKQLKDRSLIFFSSYPCYKGKSLGQSENICASFYWPPLASRVLFGGPATRLSSVDSAACFCSSPFDCQAAAIISIQSAGVDGYGSLLGKCRSFFVLFQASPL
jgi:Pyridoxamine-phosphate oxidase